MGKTIPEVHKAYLAGFIDGDGAIIWPSSNATRPNGSGSVFGCGSKRPSCVNQTWRGYATTLALARFERSTAAGSGWSKTSRKHDGFFERFDRLRASKRGRSRSLLEILEHRVESVEDLRKLAEMADALSLLNARSRGRRQNTAAMIQGFVSRND